MGAGGRSAMIGVLYLWYVFCALWFDRDLIKDVSVTLVPLPAMDHGDGDKTSKKVRT